MAASRVYGNKVKEPKVVRRNVLPAEDLTADLAKAWSTFGQAKSVLQKLESKTTSPPAKASRHRQPAVSFKPHPPQGSKVTDAPMGHVTGILKSVKSRESGKEYLVELAVLNETGTMRQDVSYNGQGVTHTVGGGTHTNPTAVFGPPAAFGTTTATKKAPHTNPPSQSLPVTRPSSTATHTQTSARRLTSSAAAGTRGVGSKRPLSEEVPIRRFELPLEVARALTTKVEQQKQAMSGHQTSKHGQGAQTRDYMYKPSSYQDTTHTTGGVAKKRKVTSAPPPRSYSGFSSTHSKSSKSTPSTAHTSLQWKPNVERVGGGVTQQTTGGLTVSKENTAKVRHPGSKVRKVHRMTSSDVPHSESIKPPGIITTSSWRSGKQLTDKILREKQPKKSPSPPPDSSSSSLFSSVGPAPTSSRQKSGATAPDPLSTWTKKSAESKFDDILVDLELSPDTESATEEVSKEERMTGGLKRAKSSKTEVAKKKQKVTSEPTQPAERVKHYDQSKVQAYIQRQREERRKKAQLERESLAQASNERQKKLQELYEAQRKRVELNLRRKQKKRREDLVQSLASGPGVHIHFTDPSSSTVSEDSSLPTLTITQPPTTQHSPRGTGRTTSYMHTSPPSHLHPSPPPHPSPKTSPLRHNRLHRAETSSSPHRGQSSSPSTSPRTYTFQPSTSPRQQPTEHAQSSLRPHPSSPPTSTAYLLFTPSPPKSPKSYDERLQAIRASALRLKEQIAMESKRALDKSHEEVTKVPRYHHQANKQGHTPLTDLPGVHNVREHALQAERLKRENAAACKIQAAYRGHSVRKILKRRPPPPQLTPTVAPPTTTPTTTVPTSSAAAPTVTMTMPTTVIQAHPPSTVHVHDKVAPWKQGGGDSHSVINVFTRQHEQLRENLSLLSNQKREEIRTMSSLERLPSSENRTPQHSTTLTPSTSSHLSPTARDLPPSQHSTPTPSIQALNPEPPQVLDGSLSPLPLSQDSLYTPPRTHPPNDMSSPRSSSLSSQGTPPRGQSSPLVTPPKGQSSPQVFPLQGSPKGTSPGVQSSPSKHDTSSSGSSSHTAVTEDVPAITPPGSTSFVDSFSTLSPHPPHVPPTSTAHTHGMSGRLSPRSLELEHQAQLHLYETVEENLRHLSHVDRVRDVSLAQQETTALAQQLQTQEQAHRSDLSALAAKAKLEVGQKQLEAEAAERMRRLEEQMSTKVQQHTQRIAEMQADSERAVREATLRLNEARSAATSAVIEAAQQQVQAAHTMAVSVATAATREAVKEALKHSHPEDMGTVEYASDFEPSTAHPDKSGEESDQTSHLEGTGEETSVDTTLTPPPADETLVDGGVESDGSSPQEVLEEDVSESEHSPHSLSSRSQTPSKGEQSPHSLLSRSQTPSQEEQSPSSPAGDESFFAFTSRMVSEYVKEEEARARHRAALLELREKALQEKTKVHLMWLQLKQKDVRSKGADDLMPPLKKKERGVLRGFQKEKAEIQRLKKAQEAAAQERRLMLLEQQEISRMRKSAQFYRDKIRSYRSRSHASPSPAPSIDESIHSHMTHSIATSLSDVSTMEEGLATPTDHLQSTTFPTYSLSTPQEASTPREVSGEGTASHHDEPGLSQYSEKSPLQRSGKRSLSQGEGGLSLPVTLEDLKELEASDAERYLAQRKLLLDKKRQAAVEVIQKHRELLKKEQELDREEQSVNKLVDEAMEMLRQTPLSRGPVDSLGLSTGALRVSGAGESSRLPRPPSSGSEMPRPLSTVSELLNATESIAEQMSASSGGSKERLGTVTSEIPSEYAADTFESLHTTLTPSHHPHPLTASTPETKMEDELSIADSISTTTSTGSGLEARIRALKEQLRQRKEEVKRVQNEQRRKKKAILKQHEEQLMKKIEAVDQKTKRVMSSAPLPLILSPDTPSSISEPESGDKSPSESSRESSPVHQTLSSREGSVPHTISSREGSIPHTISSREGSVPHTISSREGSVPLTVSSREGSGSPELASSRERSPSLEEQAGTPSPIATEMSKSPLPKENLTLAASPLPEEPAGETFSYTPFSTERSVDKEGNKELSLTALSTEPVHTELEDENETEPESDDMESRLGSMEALVPPPGFDITTESAEAPPPPSTAEQPTEPTVMMEPTMEVEEKDVEGEGEYPEDFNSPEPTETLEDINPPEPAETLEDINLPEPAENLEDINPPEPVENLEARSDTSLSISISGSKGGDSEEEVNYSPGQRVLVGGVMEGVIRFVGKTHFAPGLWIGIEFSEPRGRNDGSIDDQRYFDCSPKHGVFAPPRKVEVIEDVIDKEAMEMSPPGSTVTEELESEDDVSMSGGGSPSPVGGAQSPVDSDRDHYSEPSIEQDQVIRGHSRERSPSPDHAHSTVLSTDQISEHISEVAQEESTLSEQQAPAEVELVGEKPDVLPSAPEALAQYLQPATPTPAPPPEFAEGASREESIEPPPTPVEHLERKPDKVTDELTQELMNEAYDTMHKIWKSKRSQEAPPEKKEKVDVVQVPRDKEVRLSLDQKADRITDQLLALLLQSESSLMTNILTSKEHTKTTQVETEPVSPIKRRPTLQITVSNIKESSPPPLSPPSPYRIPPAVFPPVDHSPPTTPPCHFPQHSTGRVAAGEKSPFSQDSAHTPATLERTYSTESLVHRLDTIKVTTAQCMVPSERAHVDEVVKHAWEVAMEIGPNALHSQDVQCPEHIVNLFKDVRELSPEEEHCHKSYIELVFGLTVDIIRQLHPLPPVTTAWLKDAVMRAPLGARGAGSPSLELVQKRVYAALIRGQLPPELPAVKFLHGRKRPGGKEVDFVDGILIKELRYEEPSWVDYHKDEVTVKTRIADSILDSLLTETVEIMQGIEQERRQRMVS